MMRVLIFFLITSISTSVFAKDKVVATVNGKKITQSQLEKKYKQNLLYVSHKEVTKESVLQEMIYRLLGVEKAKKNNLQKDPTVAEKLDDILYHAQLSKDLERELFNLQKKPITDSDLKKYYSTHPEYRTSHILLRVSAAPKKEEVKEAYEAAIKIYTEVSKSPNNFAELAKKYSQTNVAQYGGDLGFQPSTRLAPNYYKAILNQKVGFITKPVRTQYGFHIIKVTDKKEFDKINKNLYKKIIYDIRRDDIIISYHKQLAKKAKIKVYKKNL